MAVQEVRLVGEGGVEWTFELPLSETFADQVTKGCLRPADPESAAAVADLTSAAFTAAASDDDETEPVELTLAEQIDAVATHAAANELGKTLGLEFEEKKPALDAKKQAMHEAAAASDDDETEPV